MTTKTEALLCLEYGIKWIEQHIDKSGAYRVKSGLESVQNYILADNEKET